MTIIIGIDPGSRRTGYGIIESAGQRNRYCASGHLNLIPYPPHERLRQIFLGMQQLVEQYQPDEVAIEQIFMHENARSALMLGQARGAALVAFTGLIHEYTPREIKKSIVGSGAASKEQVQFMVAKLLTIQGRLQADAADALAVALCHAHRRIMNTIKTQSSCTSAS